MWFTRDGWNIADALLPQHWFDNALYRQPGRALLGATGSAYRIPISHPTRRGYSAVVKFSRFGQSIGNLCLDPGLDYGWSAQALSCAQFSDPFEEFGHVTALKARLGLSLTLKRPLLIYSPPRRYLDWQLGREAALRDGIQARFAADQSKVKDCPSTSLEWDRMYIMLYQWLDGIDAGQAVRAHLLPLQEAQRLAKETAARLRSAGYVVFDHKIPHLILKMSRTRGWVRRGADLAVGLVDYELLLPCSESARQPCEGPGESACPSRAVGPPIPFSAPPLPAARTCVSS